MEVKEIYPKQKKLDDTNNLIATVSGKKGIFSEFNIAIRGYLKYKGVLGIPWGPIGEHKRGSVTLTCSWQGSYTDILTITGMSSDTIKAILKIRTSTKWGSSDVREEIIRKTFDVLNPKKIESLKKIITKGKWKFYKGGDGLERLFNMFEYYYSVIKPKLASFF